MEYIFRTKSDINQPLLNLLHINMKEQHCTVNACCFLCE